MVGEVWSSRIPRRLGYVILLPEFVISCCLIMPNGSVNILTVDKKTTKSLLKVADGIYTLFNAYKFCFRHSLFNE